MFDTTQSLKAVIDRREVDLDQMRHLMVFIFYGVSREREFKILRGVEGSEITQEEALRIKAKILRLFNNKPKSRLRNLLPAVLLGIIEFGIQKGEGVDLEERLNSFTNLIYTLSNRRASRPLARILRQISTLLDLPHYSDTLNSLFDPFAQIFDGETPNSFTNANNEFKTILDLQRPLQIVQTPSAAESAAKLVPANKGAFTAAPRDDGDVYRFLWGKDNNVITFTDEQLTYFGATLVLGGLVGFFITRKRLRKMRGL